MRVEESHARDKDSRQSDQRWIWRSAARLKRLMKNRSQQGHRQGGYEPRVSRRLYVIRRRNIREQNHVRSALRLPTPYPAQDRIRRKAKQILPETVILGVICALAPALAMGLAALPALTR